MRRNSLGFDFPGSSASGDSLTAGSFLDDEEADADSAFVDDDLESSWDQLRLRQFKEELAVAEVETKTQARSGGHLFVRLIKRLMTVSAVFANAGLDKYEKIILLLALLLIADTAALTYLLATYPVYRDVLNRLGYQILYNSTSFFSRASPLRDL